MSGLASVLPSVGEPERGYGVCLWSRAGDTEEFGIVPISPGYSGDALDAMCSAQRLPDPWGFAFPP